MTDSPDPRACRTPGANPDWWTSDNPREQHAARTLCSGCDVRHACLELALREREYHGIWGGLDLADRVLVARWLGIAEPAISSGSHGMRTRYVGTRNTPGCRCLACTKAHARYEHLRRTGQLPEKEPLYMPHANEQPVKVTW